MNNSTNITTTTTVKDINDPITIDKDINHSNSFDNDTTTTIVYNVFKDNFDKYTNLLKDDLIGASFISFDTEFSGLGYNKGFKLNDFQEKYQAFASVIKNRSIFEFGISIFKEIDHSRTGDSNNKRKLNQQTTTTTNNEHLYFITIYNFKLYNSNDFMISPNSMTFLVKHGFDFNQLFLNGIPYSNRNHKDIPMDSPCKRLLHILSASRLPLVVHNGIFDLLFIYSTFIYDLPDQLHDFIAKLLSFFPTIFDTKYISEFKISESKSFLEYLFNKYFRFNSSNKSRGQDYISCQVKYLNNVVPLESLINSNSSDFDNLIEICQDYSNHGYCKLNDTCPYSHNIDQILNIEEKKRSKKKSKKNKDKDNNIDNDSNNIDDNNNQQQILNDNNINLKKEMNIHSAGFDSVMTGFIFLHYKLLLKNSIMDSSNKIYISGKPIPLVLQVSKYTPFTSSDNNKVGTSK
ncbi:hypothetical protein CYY_004642 [Polysphondylium violaceum]|uniref:C3H1-type domain-containing protein n=1 Tax=Polysphondylium violaceum TaxID=133409 RepID=A0A8J4PT13_9MYCE|nr:hypothetical protein CYY_004642 [Polysphondylium violaceum]